MSFPNEDPVPSETPLKACLGIGYAHAPNNREIWVRPEKKPGTLRMLYVS